MTVRLSTNMVKKGIKMRAVLAIIALVSAQPCFAQTDLRPGPPAGRPLEAGTAGWSITVGVAPVLSPAWQGSRDMALAIFPDLRINYKDVIFASIPDGLGWNVVNHDGWKAGPLAKLRFGRDEERGGSPFLITGGSDALRGLGDVDAAVETGGFIEKRAGPWRGRIEVRRGFGGHDGVVADGSVAYQARRGRTIINVGPRATLASREYIETYFGIDAVQSQRSGLRPYSASGGLLSYGVGGTVIRPLSRRSAVTLFTGLDQLGQNAGDSPLVRERGRRTQFTLGLGYGFRFNL
ncbi:MipA/OmpV family protein [Sphingomonas sp. 22R3R2A-7]|uniref:MipA/OmpV family protein n=1 Tax=Sphingomonas sp. 22R3R2A-7 TaxID=3050230 RepID=UPI002FE26476